MGILIYGFVSKTDKRPGRMSYSDIFLSMVVIVNAICRLASTSLLPTSSIVLSTHGYATLNNNTIIGRAE